MLIISPTQFLEELKETKSKSISIGESLSRTDLQEKEDLDIKEGTLVPDSVVMESSTYDSFRKKSLPNIPKELKAVVGALGSIQNQQEVAEAFGVSKDTVGTLANDKHSNAEVAEVKVNILHKIKETSEKKINQCVEFVEILQGMNNKELLNTAETLSRIHKNITPPSIPTEGNIQFIFYAPERQNKLEEYEIIDAVN